MAPGLLCTACGREVETLCRRCDIPEPDRQAAYIEALTAARERYELMMEQTGYVHAVPVQAIDAMIAHVRATGNLPMLVPDA